MQHWITMVGLAVFFALTARVAAAQSEARGWKTETTEILGSHSAIVVSRDGQTSLSLFCVVTKTAPTFGIASLTATGWKWRRPLRLVIDGKTFELITDGSSLRGGLYGDAFDGMPVVTDGLLEAMAEGTTMVLAGGAVAKVPPTSLEFPMKGSATAISWLRKRCTA